MMKYYLHAWAIVAAMVLCGTSAQAQYLGIGLGRSFGDDLGAAAGGVPGALNPLSAGIREGNTLVLEAGANYLRFLRTGIHYNYSRPEGFLRRGDAFGSRAELQLRAMAAGLTPDFYTPEGAARRNADDRVHEPIRAWEYYVAVTRGEIEAIRGVSAEAGLNKLLDLQKDGMFTRSKLKCVTFFIVLRYSSTHYALK